VVGGIEISNPIGDGRSHGHRPEGASKRLPIPPSRPHVLGRSRGVTGVVVADEVLVALRVVG
jgi:hypothetical protein